jgi:cytochrome P450
MAFALYEMQAVLSTLFSQASLVRPPGSHSSPVRRGVSLAPHDGVRMIVKRYDG